MDQVAVAEDGDTVDLRAVQGGIVVEVSEQLEFARVVYGLCGLPGEAARADDHQFVHLRACSRRAATTRSCWASVIVWNSGRISESRVIRSVTGSGAPGWPA